MSLFQNAIYENLKRSQLISALFANVFNSFLAEKKTLFALLAIFYLIRTFERRNDFVMFDYRKVCGEKKRPGRPCATSEFRCHKGGCISLQWHCDSDIDCQDGSDELDCEGKVECRTGEFRCTDGQCINLDWRCDGDKDCDDNSDEKNCR
ncbi:hypothetical protein B4U79_17984 [Dinothrombium tinctorium]|uniref:Uncharacterized protein n=1 Tax=Dinothrombium tinctorium TaxID=1965070 RepID=A0A3S3SAW3_9ACAR|nr:hypothetical protein B4U79_18204 [Dinothrombium tinctorium]RWS12856.1 hypothetical protein B4U79_17985 [Dinothrombium tinctorium]RWS12887.1 hypothetical protein B4U79_17984 [Dinothrombium tinctorium]